MLILLLCLGETISLDVTPSFSYKVHKPHYYIQYPRMGISSMMCEVGGMYGQKDSSRKACRLRKLSYLCDPGECHTASSL